VNVVEEGDEGKRRKANTNQATRSREEEKEASSPPYQANRWARKGGATREKKNRSRKAAFVHKHLWVTKQKKKKGGCLRLVLRTDRQLEGEGERKRLIPRPKKEKVKETVGFFESKKEKERE